MWKKLVVTVALFGGWSRAEAAPVGGVAVIDRVVARVGTGVIWQSEVDERMRRGSDPPVDRGAALAKLIDEELILAEGARHGIDVDDASVAAAIEDVKRRASIDDAGLDVAIGEQGMTRAQYAVDVQRQIRLIRTRNQLLSPKVHLTEAEVDAEATTRGYRIPVAAAAREELREELHTAKVVGLAGAWLDELRARAYIERRP